MDCNKEEAIRAKELAERKMQIKDFVGAQKIAGKAQKLFPELENISQVLTVCNVHCSAAVKVAGSEMDWYGILQVEPTADEASIKKQYRKLALQLHPDKNKFAGAEAAFKLIGEAHMVLTDQSKRSLYDMKRKVSVSTINVRQAPPHMNRNFYTTAKQPNFQNNSSNFASSQFPDGPGMNNQQQTQAMTFWTMCPFCSVKYQYYQSVMNRALRCQSCQKPFIAYDVSSSVQGTAGMSFRSSWNHSGVPQQRAACNQNDSRAAHQDNFGNSSSSTGSHAATSRRQPAEKRARPEEKVEDLQKPAQNRRRGRKAIVEESSESCDTDSSNEDEDSDDDDLLSSQNVKTTNSHYPRRSTRQRLKVTYSEGGSDDDEEFFNPPKKARKSGVSCETVDRSQGGKNSKEDSNRKGETVNGPSIVDDKKEGQSETNEEIREQEAEVDDGEERSKDQDTADGSMTYAEPEFNDFDKDRTESHVAVDQIWAAYDTNGCMPRYYACIKRILSKQSKLIVTWLEPHPNPEEQDVVDWVEEELPYACGRFQLGSTETVDFRAFSYRAFCEIEKRTGMYKIYPRKGDMWALFKDWSINWSSDPDKHREYKYEIVEVISDFDDKTGVKVVRLGKLKGFVSLFHQLGNIKTDSFLIKPSELLRFSHKIPSYRMTGEERDDVPEGSYELDPASLPSDIEETEFVHLKSGDDPMDGLRAQANGLGARSASAQDECKAAQNYLDPNEKNIKKTVDTKNKGQSPSGFNRVYVKKQKCLESENSNSHGFFNVKEDEPSSTNYQVEKEKCSDAAGNCFVDAADHEIASPGASAGEKCDYPDPEFYAFGANKAEDSFKPGQVWALYSDIDGLPKFYGQIKKVGSTDFEVEVAWLEACRPSGDEIWWSNEELPVGCGMFRLLRGTDTYNTTMTFSHVIKEPETIAKNKYLIYPRVGEVWALYKNLNADWTTNDLENCDYDIVRVIRDHQSGLSVVVLKKVVGYSSVFMDCDLKMDIPRKDFLRFSHNIPYFLLTEERGGKLRGYYELDPAAVPPILFCTALN